MSYKSSFPVNSSLVPVMVNRHVTSGDKSRYVPDLSNAVQNYAWDSHQRDSKQRQQKMGREGVRSFSTWNHTFHTKSSIANVRQILEYVSVILSPSNINMECYSESVQRRFAKRATLFPRKDIRWTPTMFAHWLVEDKTYSGWLTNGL